jgi:hypothetical protein
MRQWGTSSMRSNPRLWTQVTSPPEKEPSVSIAWAPEPTWTLLDVTQTRMNTIRQQAELALSSAFFWLLAGLNFQP